jgi:diguanylate cyclase (GGDEF)-like protein
MAEKDQTRRQLDEEHEKMMKDLEQRSERASMLAKMGELLQSCVSRDEVITVALSFAPKIFPSARGAIFWMNSSRNAVEVIGSWSDCELAATDFEVGDCWALRTGQPHLVYADESTARCRHAAELSCSHLCIPILAQGETLGILHLQKKQNAARLDAAELSFRMTFAGQIGLSIANIKLRDALRTQSIRDALTGLYNRRHLEEILEREIRRSARAQQHLGIIVIDLDHFKSFNDAYGHDAGDAVLCETGLSLTSGIRAEDFVCRYGGEEFVVVLPTANLEAARARAETLRLKMKELTILHQGKSMGMITISAGVAVFPDHGTTPREVIAAADAALYEAKRNGRDQVAVALPKAGEEISLPASTKSAANC